MNLENIVIVAMDLGLMIGLNYVILNEERVKGIVMFEGIFRTARDALRNMSLSSRLTMRIMRNKKIAESVFVKNGEKAVESFISSSIIRSLSEEEMKEYIEPLKDEKVRRKVWFEGVGPNTIRPKSEFPGNLTDLIRNYSDKLCKSDISKLLLYAKPGSAVTEKTINYAKENMKNIDLEYIGEGKHFLPEDQPENITDAIVEFIKRI